MVASVSLSNSRGCRKSTGGSERRRPVLSMLGVYAGPIAEGKRDSTCGQFAGQPVRVPPACGTILGRQPNERDHPTEKRAAFWRPLVRRRDAVATATSRRVDRGAHGCSSLRRTADG